MTEFFVVINSGIPGALGKLTIPVSRSVQIKYDNMTQQHSFYLWLSPFGDKVEILTMRQGLQLAQKIVEYSNDALIGGIEAVISEADIPKLIKLFDAAFAAGNPPRRPQ